MVGSNESFVGCIGDMTLADKVINFADSTEQVGAIIGKCILDVKIGSDTDVHTVPVLPPIEEIDAHYTTEPEFYTDSPFENRKYLLWGTLR